VSFQSQDGATVIGVRTRDSVLIVALVTDAGQCWNVSPIQLQPVAARAEGGTPNAVVPVKK
jgi:hypothetical protein